MSKNNPVSFRNFDSKKHSDSYQDTCFKNWNGTDGLGAHCILYSEFPFSSACYTQ